MYWNREHVKFENFDLVQSTEFPDNIENMVIFLNNEDRAFASVNHEELDSSTTVHLVVLNRLLEDHNNPALDKLIDRMLSPLKERSIPFKIHYLDFYSDNFSVNLTEIFTQNNIFSQNLIVDITSCPPPVIIPLGEVFLSHQNAKMYYAYTLPEAYNTELIREIDQKQTNGVTIRRYGLSDPNDTTTLAIITGFEDNKAKLVHEEVNPDFGYLFNYLFTRNIDDLKRAKEIMELHQDMIEMQDYKQFNLSRYDVNKILNTLLLTESKNTSDRLIIAPFGSKIQRLASILFVSKKQGRELIDVIPDELNFQKISTGVSDTLYYCVKRSLE